jgi:pseudouridine-5'-phosphate glycosidase
VAIPAAEVEAWIRVATGEAARGGISGGRVTPFILGRVADLSGGRTLRANIGLIVHNARIAAQIAVADAGWARSS